jgi:ubiquinone/menaquinone biosynthesis C-methylase UbiE
MEENQMNKNQTQEQFTLDDTISPNRINEMVMGFRQSRILLTAYELELFTALSGESKSSAEIAKMLGTDQRATDRLMNALCGIELLTKKGDKFSNAPIANKFLVKSSPDYMAGLGHVVHLWDSWSTLTEAVYKGHPVIDKKINDRGDQWLTAFIAAMHDRAKKNAAVVVSELDLSEVLQVLDVGGGSGAYAMAFVKAKKDIKAAVFDLPNVIPITGKYIETEGFGGKVNTIVGDYHVDPLGKGYGLVFLSAIIHSNSPGENIKLLKKCSKALNPGGQVVVQDFIMDEDRTTPPFGALFALNMLVGTEAGDTYTEAEVSQWMTNAGLSGIKRIDTPSGTSLIIGKQINK